jgi:hypothetical protein
MSFNPPLPCIMERQRQAVVSGQWLLVSCKCSGLLIWDTHTFELNTLPFWVLNCRWWAFTADTVDSLFIYLCSCCSHLEHRASVKRFVSIQFPNLRQSVGPLGRVISPSQGRYPHRTTQRQNKRRQTFMLWVGIEPAFPAFEWAMTFHALDRAATVIGRVGSNKYRKVQLIG